MSAGTFKTFAYGSNMQTARVRKRCPSATPKGVAELRSYELHWHKQSQDGSGKCAIVRTYNPENRVLGVLYEIVNGEKQALDKAEGLGQGYEEIDVLVVCNGREIAAKAYRALNVSPMLKPYTWYHAFVVAGAKEHGLPTDYIAQIEQVACDEDSDRERHQKNVRMLEGVRA